MSLFLFFITFKSLYFLTDLFNTVSGHYIITFRSFTIQFIWVCVYILSHLFTLKFRLHTGIDMKISGQIRHTNLYTPLFWESTFMYTSFCFYLSIYDKITDWERLPNSCYNNTCTCIKSLSDILKIIINVFPPKTRHYPGGMYISLRKICLFGKRLKWVSILYWIR